MVHPVLRHPLASLTLTAVLSVCSAPAVAQPQSAQPQSAQPQSAQPQSAQPQSAQPQSAQPQSAQYRLWRPPDRIPWARLLTRVDAGVDDSDPLAQPMRYRSWGLSEPVGFEGLWRLPVSPDDPDGQARYVRADGGLYAVFTTSEYAADGTLPLIPANTVFHIGPPAELRLTPAPLAPDETGSEAVPAGPRIDVKAWSKLGGDTPQQYTVTLSRTQVDPDDQRLADPAVESADVRLPRIRQAETERARRVREILRRAVTDPDSPPVDNQSS
jgi:hypothetical protein